MNFLNKKDRQVVYDLLHDFYGREAQLAKAIEELAELQIELTRILQKKDVNKDLLAGEIADVRNMLEQLEMFYGLERQVVETQSYKIERIHRKITTTDKR